MPENSKCETFLAQKRVSGGDITGHPVLPQDKLSKWGMMEPFYPEWKRWRRSRDGVEAEYQGKVHSVVGKE